MSEARTSWIPKRCVFETTLACNLSCAHCGSSAGRGREDELTTDEARRVLRELAGLGCGRVTLSGGEAMLRPDWLDLIAAGTAAGMRVGLITNGLLLDRSAARAARAAGLVSVGLSLDGIGAVHDDVRRHPGLFGAVGAAMEAARAARLPFSAITQIHRRNTEQLAEIRELLIDVGAFAWQLQLSMELGELCAHPGLALDPAELPRTVRRVAGLVRRGGLRIDVGDNIGYFGPEERALRGGGCFTGCQAGLTVLGIESNGDVKGCLSLQPGRCADRDRWVEGNLRQSPLAEIWNRPGAFGYNRDFRIDGLGGGCGACTYAARCRGGCLAMRAAAARPGDGGTGDNRLCVHRVLAADSAGRGKPAMAAAALLAALLGAGASGCSSVTLYDGPAPDDGGPDGGTDSVTDTDTDTDTGTDSGTDTN